MALIAHYPLNGDANDYTSLSPLNGSVTNAVVSSTGKIGQSYYFDGNGDYISFSGSASKLDIRREISMAVWVNASNTSTSYQGLFLRQTQGVYESWIHNGKFMVGIKTNGGAIARYSSSASLSNNTWYHLCWTYDGSNVRIYINGSLDSTTSKTGIIDASDQTLYIGYSGYSTEYFTGYVNDARIYDHALSLMEIKELAKAKVLHYSFNYIVESTTNMVEDNAVTPGKNSYPATGNEWGTYWTGQYNNNTYFSIGSIVSVSNNVITTDGTGRAIYTYDVLRPQTTGGGVTAGTDYFIKVVGTNQFTLHAYNSSEDGSQGYINPETGDHKVFDSIALDQRISVNSTSFPTMWWGAPHKPNSALVKEIIPNAIGTETEEFDGHSFIRLHFDHKSGAVDGGMAYGVYIEPEVLSGTTYSISFWYRAGNSSSIGKTIYMSLYSGGGWSATSGTKTCSAEWQRATFTSVPPTNQTTSTYMYFWPENGSTIDISEIQVEKRSTATEFTSYTRTGKVYDISGFKNDSDLSLDNSPVWSSTSRLGSKSVEFNGSNQVIERSMLSSMGTNSFTVNMWAYFNTSSVRDVMFGNFDTTQDFNFEKLTNNNLRFYWNGSPDVSSSTNTIPIGEWCMLTAVRERISSTSSYIRMYVNGQEVYNNTGLTVNDLTSLDGTLRLGRDQRTTTEAMEGKLDDVRVYMTALSATDIQSLYERRAAIDNSGNVFADEIKEISSGNPGFDTKGVANFVDYSNVGITDGMIGYWTFQGDTEDYSGYEYNAVEYSSGNGPAVTSDGIVFSSGDGLKAENIISAIDNSSFTIIIKAQSDGTFLSNTRLAMGYPDNTLELNVRSTFAGITLRDSGGYRSAVYSTSLGTNVFHYAATFDSSNGTLKYYHDGVYRSQYLNHLNDVTFGDNLLFGNWTSLTQSFTGTIYYAKVFNRVLTAEEIAIEYKQTMDDSVTSQISNDRKLYFKGDIFEGL